jgi:cob(I)alamin adenosyltransferase
MMEQLHYQEEEEISKQSIRVEAYGSVDELISWIGLLRDYKENGKRKPFLIYLQSELMACAAALASDPQNPNSKQILPDPDCVSRIEQEIDDMEKSLIPLQNFILPGGHILVSYCHIARCVCRRAERAVLRLYEAEESPEIVNKLLNRLSDYLFVLSRKIALELDIEEIKWSV